MDYYRKRKQIREEFFNYLRSFNDEELKSTNDLIADFFSDFRNEDEIVYYSKDVSKWLKKYREMIDVGKKNKENFLEDLSELSRKYKIFIGGCGCCGSPWIECKLNKRTLFYLGKELEYLEDKEKYVVDYDEEMG